MSNEVAVTGAGVGSLAAACLLKRVGYDIDIPEVPNFNYRIILKDTLFGPIRLTGNADIDGKTLEAIEPGARGKFTRYSQNTKSTAYKQIRKHFSSAEVQKIIEFPFAFVGLNPRKTQKQSKLTYSHINTMPGALLMRLTVDRHYSELKQHIVVLPKNWEANLYSIFESKQWPSDPAFYINAPSEFEVFLHIPVSATATYTPEDLQRYAYWVLGIAERTLRLEDLRKHIVSARIVGEPVQ